MVYIISTDLINSINIRCLSKQCLKSQKHSIKLLQKYWKMLNWAFLKAQLSYIAQSNEWCIILTFFVSYYIQSKRCSKKNQWHKKYTSFFIKNMWDPHGYFLFKRVFLAFQFMYTLTSFCFLAHIKIHKDYGEEVSFPLSPPRFKSLIKH